MPGRQKAEKLEDRHSEGRKVTPVPQPPSPWFQPWPGVHEHCPPFVWTLSTLPGLPAEATCFVTTEGHHRHSAVTLMPQTQVHSHYRLLQLSERNMTAPQL